VGELPGGRLYEMLSTNVKEIDFVLLDSRVLGLVLKDIIPFSMNFFDTMFLSTLSVPEESLFTQMSLVLG
jgi:hypothetical protein